MLTSKRVVAHLLASLSPIALGVTPAMAQDAPSNPGPAANPSGEIIVTAQRRNERLIDVPMSVTALSGAKLVKSAINDTLALAQITPGLQLPMNGAYTQPAIRGISSSGSGLASSSNVAVYVDGVYQPSQTGQLMELPDVEDVEVLKGPQGTLYGQNAAGGAIIINTVTPSFTWKGNMAASYGNYNDKAVHGSIAGPITSKLAFALAGSWENRDGFNQDLLRGGHDKGLRSDQIRARLLWEASPDASITFNGFYSRRYDSTPYATQPYNNISIGVPYAGLYGLPLPTRPHQFTQSIEPLVGIRSYGFSMLGKIKLGEIGTLSTVTAYGNVHVIDMQDSDLTGVNLAELNPFIVKQHDFIQEFNFLSRKMAGFTVSAGLFYMYNTEKWDPYVFKFYDGSAYPTAPKVTAVYGNTSQNKRNDYAAYLEATYDMTDKLSITAGGRYSTERQMIYGAGFPDPNMQPDPRGAFHSSKFTPRGVIRFKPDNQTTLYASVSQGFKTGFVDANSLNSCYNAATGHAYQCIPLSAPVKPEVVTSYEIGYKGKVVDVLTLGLAGFHTEYSNIQVFIYDPTAGSRYLNAAKARINGMEFDASLKVMRDLTLSVGGVYLDAKYASFPNAQAFVPYASVPGGCPSQSSMGGNCTVSVDASGNRLMRAPKLSGNINLDYDHTADWGQFGFSANLSYNSGFYFDPAQSLRQGRYALLNGQIFVQSQALHGIRLAVYGKNLTNNNYLASVLESTVGNSVSYGSPRQYGVQVSYRF